MVDLSTISLVLHSHPGTKKERENRPLPLGLTSGDCLLTSSTTSIEKPSTFKAKETVKKVITHTSTLL